MSTQDEIQKYFDQFQDSLSMRAYTNEHDEFFMVVLSCDKKKSKPLNVGVLELGQSVADFLNDTNYDRIMAILLDSENYIKEILNNPDDLSRWLPFYLLSKSLTEIDILNEVKPAHPFYNFLIQEIVNAYKRKLHNSDGSPYPTDHFSKIGLSYERLRTQLHQFADVCLDEAAKDGASATDQFVAHMPTQSLSFGHIVGEPVPAREYNPDEPMIYQMTEVLYPDSPEDIGSFLCLQYLKKNVLFKRCEYCCHYFVATGRSNVKYCDRIYKDTGKTCRQIAPQLTFHEKQKGSPADKIFNRAYKTLHSRISAGRISKPLFKEWSKDARQKRDACNAGQITLEDFEKWLSEYGL